MSEDVLEKAIAKKKQLADEIKGLDAFISMYRRLQAGEAQFVAYPPVVTITPRPRESIESVSTDILRETGETLPTKEILLRLGDLGIEVRGKDPTNNLASVLSRSKEIENVRGKGWRLKREKPITEAPYDTETDDAPPEQSSEAS